jgi:hypothetical protein
MLALTNIALGLVISATPVAAQADRSAAQKAAESTQPKKDPAKASPPEKPEQNARPNMATQESLRPPIGPRTTQGLAEDAISRGGR